MSLSAPDAGQGSRDRFVSVVIPTVRFDEHLDAAILSILAQDIADLEIILVLDGVPMCEQREWSKADRLRVLELATRVGTPGALNAGIAAAKGEFIARLDADDLAMPHRLRLQRDFLLDNLDVGCVGSFVRLIDDAGEDLGGLESVVTPEEVRSRLMRSNPLVHSSVMYRRSVVTALGMYSSLMVRMQDYELFLRLAAMSSISILPEYLSAYRVHPGQHSRNSVPWKPYTFEILRKRSDLARAVGVSQLRQSLRNATWFVGQVVRHFGVVRPGYLRGAK
ncbi:glycosyltransferase [Microbacterium esteraromaticum]|uniref:glycosyltransferase n=1 Tax=Microbacterium esteraromaticum TaxID=57043 RepID=UPI0019D36E27|nr:glycosyltransferase [Microbacterium esteraromaticum]MBN7793381.1 glycosyltransferase [Microbacterium esteraromaticum]